MLASLLFFCGCFLCIWDCNITFLLPFGPDRLGKVIIIILVTEVWFLFHLFSWCWVKWFAGTVSRLTICTGGKTRLGLQSNPTSGHSPSIFKKTSGPIITTECTICTITLAAQLSWRIKCQQNTAEPKRVKAWTACSSLVRGCSMQCPYMEIKTTRPKAITPCTMCHKATLCNNP